MRRSFLFGKCSGKVLCSCFSDAFHGLTSSDQRKDLYESTAMKEGGATSSFKRDEAGDGVPSGDDPVPLSALRFWNRCHDRGRVSFMH